MTQFEFEGVEFSKRVCVWLVREIRGPLYRVTTNAPESETIVPKILAWLLLLFKATFSILKE